MAATDGQILLAAARWGDEGHYLREFVAKHQLPQVVKIIKGQYMNLGVPTLPNPSLHSTVLLVSAGWRLKIAAQSVKFKEGRRVIPVGPKFSIPDSYGGFFEILSEDGRPVRCIESVAELARRFPDSCLVRDNIRAYVSRSEDINSITEKSRTVPAGETLVLVGEVIGTKGKGQNRFLRCFDSKGENVYLPYDQRGRFSAIAKEDNISGVHSVKNLLTKRMPLMVRLVHGTPPLGIKNPNHFIPELRLYTTFEEEHMFALPLQKDSTIMAVPMSAPLKVQKAKNEEQLKSMKEFLRLTDKSGRLMLDVADRIQVFDATLSKEMRFGDKHLKAHQKSYFLRRSISTDSAHHPHRHIHHRTGKSAPPTPTEQDENENPAIDDYDEIDQIYDYVRGFAPLPKSVKSPFVKSENNSPASSPTSTPSHVEIPVVDKLPPDDSPKPEPPPIETIPTKKAQQGVTTPTPEITSPAVANEGVTVLVSRSSSRTDLKEKRRERSGEKRTRKASLGTNSVAIGTTTEKSPGLKLYIKSANHRNAQKARIFRHKSSSPLKESVPLRVSSTTVMAQPLSPGTVKSMSPSPLFNIRYKSLTNLAMDFDTLDSSNSGGRTSGDSAGSAVKLPEKRSRRLSRPRSLTNLVWEIRGNSPTPPNTPNPVVSTDPNPTATRHPLILPPPPELERQIKLEPRVYRKNSKGSKMGSAVDKRIGTLYL